MGDEPKKFEEILDDFYAEFDRRLVEILEAETARLRAIGLSDAEAASLASIKFQRHAKIREARDARILKEGHGAQNALSEVG
jgi:hypothetical protein